MLHYPFLSTDQAEEVFEFIEKIYPNTYETIFWHGTMLFIYVAYYEKAIELLRKAVGIDPQRAEAYILLAQALEEGGQDEGVEFLYKKASLIKPEWPNAWDGLINLFIKQKRFKEAYQVVQEALKQVSLDYVHSEDIIQVRHDELVSGRSRTCHVKQDLQRFLETIEAEETKENDKNI